MNNRWFDHEAREFIGYYAAHGEDLALRVYTSRLIGAEAALVLHGGGNTSVKGMARNLLGEPMEVLYVKGSGWDLAGIEPAGFPAIDLAWIRRLRALTQLSDEEMVNTMRTHLMDASSPNPSVEALLHGFLPHRFVDHSHADAILALTNLPNGADVVREALGPDVAIVDYIMPGFALARRAAEIAEQHPDAHGLVLMKHGLFTFGDTARESYSRHVDIVSRAESWLARHQPPQLVVSTTTDDDARRLAATRVAELRGALSRPYVLQFRTSPALRAFAAWTDGTGGPLTPDHVIRTKAYPMLWPSGTPAHDAVQEFASRYAAYFEENRGNRKLVRLDLDPRVVLVPDVGMFAIGADVGAASIAADLYEHTVDTRLAARGLGTYQGLPDADLFDMEYWSLEQAKLGKAKEPVLSRKVALITGGAGAIGLGVARVLLDAGAHVVLVDRDGAALARARSVLGGGKRLVTAVADVTSVSDIAAAFDAAALSFGGVDLVVANAGIAVSGPLDTMTEADWRRVVDVNLTGTWTTLSEGARRLKAQGMGGGIVLVSSKNVMGPGAEFSAYSASKAGAHQLAKVAALELAPHGIRVNMVTPDAVFAYGGVASGLWEAVGKDRAKAKGIPPEALPEHYRGRNLLKTAVTPEAVGEAVLFFAAAKTPTTGATLPVDGGIPEAFPR